MPATESVGLAAGADDYLTKPFGHREFALRVQSVARLYRDKNELVQTNRIRSEHAWALQVLLDLSCGIAGAENLEMILERTVAAAAELTGSRRVAIMLPDARGEHLTIARCIGLDQQAARAVRVPVGAGIAGHVFATGGTVIADGPERVERSGPEHDSVFFVAAPLVSKALCVGDRSVGVLNLTDRYDGTPFTDGELESIELLANVAATAINDFLNQRALDDAGDSIVIALATLAEYRDGETGRHFDRVTGYALILADELRREEPYRSIIDEGFLRALRRSMPLHDIGKVAIPDGILLKPGRLTGAEMDIMRRHAELGARTIQSIINRGHDVDFLVMARQIAHAHHEWHDGAGYPQGLAGDGIPLAARIAALADVYDALTSERPYKKAMNPRQAGEIIRTASGTQFHPDIVGAFLRREAEFASVADRLADGSDEPTAGEHAPYCQAPALGAGRTGPIGPRKAGEQSPRRVPVAGAP